MSSAEFIYINQQAVRLTSSARDVRSGAVDLVVIVRGNAARDEVTRLVADSPLEIAFPEEAPQAMRVEEIDLKSTGEGARSIHRFNLRLVPWDATADEGSDEPVAESALMQRLDAIERKLDRLIALLEEQPTR